MLTDMPINRFKHALAAGRTQIGLWSNMLHPMALEALAGAEPDWILIDCEHGPGDPNEVLAALQAMQGASVTAVVRPAWNDSVLLKRYLDLGTNAVLIPMVQSAEEAKAAVAATRYPPDGIRGVATGTRANRFGRVKDYFKLAASEMCVLVQVETRPALDRIEEIAAVDGVDVLFVGPADLAFDISVRRHADTSVYERCLEKVATAARAAGKQAGILVRAIEDIPELRTQGFTHFAVDSDLGIIRNRYQHLLKRTRESCG